MKKNQETLLAALSTNLTDTRKEDLHQVLLGEYSKTRVSFGTSDQEFGEFLEVGKNSESFWSF